MIGFLVKCRVCNSKYETYSKGWNYCPYCRNLDISFKEAEPYNRKRNMLAELKARKRNEQTDGC